MKASVALSDHRSIAAPMGRSRGARVEAVEPRQLLSAATYGYQTLYAFGGSGGASPQGAITFDAAGDMLETVEYDGVRGTGGIYEAAAGSNTFTVVAAFTGANGANPRSTLTLGPGGLYYGTTTAGGTAGLGTVFAFSPLTHALTAVASFTPATGRGTGGLVADASGDLFGVTQYDGTSGDGAIVEVAPGSGAITVVASLDSSVGNHPQGSLTIDAHGDLYGVTEEGGPLGWGGVFELAAGSHAVTQRVAFTLDYGESFTTPVVDAQGNLFGTTYGGATGSAFAWGTVYEVPAGSDAITFLAYFDDDVNGALPAGDLLLDPSGDLFGTTTGGGAYGDGTVFELPAGTHGTVSTLAQLTAPDDHWPTLTLSERAGHAYLFGTTATGGSGNTGSVFEMTPVVATRVVITAQPSSTSAGVVPIVAQLQNAAGLIDTAAAATVTLSIASGPPGAILGGTVAVQAVGGVATFDAAVLGEVGTYTLTASAPGLAAATSAPIRTTPGVATHLLFDQPPTDLTAGQPAAAIAVQACDAYGNPTTVPDGDPLSVFASGPGGVTARTLDTPALEDGQAVVWADAVLTVAGAWTLTIADATAAERGGPAILTVSQPFTVGPAAAARLVFSPRPPLSVTAAQPIGPVTVDVLDRYGNLVTTDASPVSIVTAGPAATGLSGTTTVDAQAGLATFGDLSIANAGSYTLTASDASLATAVAPIRVAAAPSITPAPTPIPAVAGRPVGPLSVTVSPGTVGNVAVQVVRQADGRAVLTRSVKVRGGQATLSALTLRQAGAYTVTFTDAAGTTTTQVVQVSAAAAARLAYAAAPAVAGGTATAAVQVLDRYGNRTTAADGETVVLQPAAKGAAVTATVAQGIATFTDVPIASGKSAAHAKLLAVGSLRPILTSPLTAT
jgi:uncharacterized repeat protein (TIGR03803 family)